MKITAAILVILVALTSPAVSAADAEDVARSVLFPGWGQYSTGRYTRGTLMMGAGLVTLAAIGGVTLQYDRYVESYESARRSYLSSSYVGEAEEYYGSMTDNWSRADDMYGYRNALIGVYAAVWAWSVIDMVAFEGPSEPPLAIEIEPDGFRLVRSFSF